MDGVAEFMVDLEKVNKEQVALELAVQEPGETPNPTVLGEQDSNSNFDKLNIYVMEHLFSFLPLQDLKNCRLVSHSWNEAIVGLMPRRPHYLPIIYWSRPPREGSRPTPYPEKCSLDDIPQLLEIIRNSDHFPWTKFKVDGRLVGDTEEKLSGLFGGIAPFVTKLWIYALHDQLFRDKFEYPQLKTLQLHCLDHMTNDQTAGQKTLDFIQGIVEGAPKLKILCLTGCNMMDNFMKILESPNTRRITNLLISSVIHNEHLIKLSQMSFQLKNLSLQFGVNSEGVEIGASTVKRFLEMQKMTLEKLQFKEVAEDQDLSLEVDFPRMANLKTIKIALPSRYPNLNYATQFPNLRKLEFWFYEPGFQTLKYWFHPGMQPVDTVEELKFSGDMNSRKIISQAGRQFPNLRKLQILGNAELLDRVSQSMPNVKDLTLLFMENDGEDVDSILTGLATENCKELRISSSVQQEAFSNSWELQPCLQNLKRLELVADHEVRITDLGCRLVLLNLKHLENLDIVGDCSWVSRELWEAMKKQFNVHRS